MNEVRQAWVLCAALLMGCTITKLEGGDPGAEGETSDESRSSENMSSSEAGDNESSAGGDVANPVTGEPEKPASMSEPMPGSGGSGEQPNANRDSPDEVVPELYRFECGSRSLSDAATLVSGRLTGQVDWSGVVALEGVVEVNDAKLTIQAGTSIVMGPGSVLDIGNYSSQTSIEASGTVDEPVTICGSEPSAGHFGQVVIRERVDTASFLRNVLVADGGGDVDSALAVEAAILLENVQVENSASAGLQASAFDDDGSAVSVFDSALAVQLDAPGAVDNFPVGGVFQGNEQNVALLTFSRLSTDTVFHNIGIPYRQKETLEVTADRLELQAGVQYEFASGRSLLIGAYSNTTAFVVSGTEDNPVAFRGAEATPGFWGGIDIADSSSIESVLRHATIADGGDDDAYALTVDRDITIDHLQLTDNAAGMWIGERGLQETSSMLSIDNTQAVPLSIAPNAWATLPRGGSFDGNAESFIDVRDGRFETVGDVPAMAVPYRILGRVELPGEAAMTVEAGAEFVMALDSSILVGAYSGQALLTIDGNEQQPVRFLGEEPNAGHWRGIEVSESAKDTGSLTWVEVRDAGGGSETSTAALILRSPAAVEHCTFSNSAGYGILHASADTANYSSNNSFDGNADGDVGEL